MQAILAAALLSIAAAPQQQGAVTSVTTSRDAVGTVRFEIRGTNPCPAVFVDFGNDKSHTYALKGLPDSTTVWYHYTRGGTYTVRIAGAGGCRGEATTRVTIDLPDVEPTPTPTPAPPVSAQPPNMRFPGMDSNRDGVVTRQEWRGSDNSFRTHDWNRDGRLDGDEVRLGAMPRGGATGAVPRRGIAAMTQWTEANFRQMDRNRNNRLERGEWRGDVEDFYRIDDSDDGVLTLNEFLLDDVDDDRGDRLADLDLNGNDRVERSEWHGSDIVFRRLDRNNDDMIDAQEAVREAPGGFPIGRGGQKGGASRGSFEVSARTAWTDTGIDVRAGDTLVFQPRGTIRWAPERTTTATPTGGSGVASPTAPVPGAKVGALVARIGDNTAFLAMNDGGTIRVTQSGRLFLGVNDDYLNDNQGAFQVTVVRR